MTDDLDSDDPLTAHEQAMIDRAWQIHRDAAPRTLLDGFGEATEQVVALRAENERLRAEVEHMRPIFDDYPRVHEVREALADEVERLRAVVNEALAQNERFDKRYRDAEAEVEAARQQIAFRDERLAVQEQNANALVELSDRYNTENERLRAQVEAYRDVLRRAGFPEVGETRQT